MLSWGAVLVLAFYLFNLSIYFDFTADDPGVTFRYAAHLFDGQGVRYNAGEAVEGYSNFGYVVVTGLVYKILSLFCEARWYLLFASKLLNAAAGLITVLYVYRYSADILGRSTAGSLLTAGLTVANGAFIINAASPLETSLLTLLVTVTMYALSRYLRDREAGSVTTGLAAVTILGTVLAVWRIDSPVLVMALGAALLIGRRFRLERRERLAFEVWAVVLLGYTVLRFVYFGHLLNNPYYAKVQYRLGLENPLRLPYVADYFNYLGLAPLLFLVIVALVTARGSWKYLAPTLLILSQWLYIAAVNGDWMPGYRFWAVVAPALTIVVTGLFDIPLRTLPGRVERVLKTGLVLLIGVTWFFSGLEMFKEAKEVPFRFYDRLSGFSARKMNPYWPTAEWINTHVRKDALMAVQEAGFIPLLTDLRAIDTYGLCNADLAHMEGPRCRLGLKLTWGPEEPGTRYILGRRPDIIVVGPVLDWMQAPSRFLGNYLLVASPQAGMNVFRREDSDCVRN